MSALTGHALTELLLVGAPCGVLGVQMVLRRLSFFTHTVGHISLLGIVPATMLGGLLGAGAGAAGLAVSLHYGVATAAGTAITCGALFAVVVITGRLTDPRRDRPPLTRRQEAYDAMGT
jgi:ABC-type Mn2+/Zn2+ transport system permease subunit